MTLDSLYVRRNGALMEVRERALERFQERGLPTPEDEDWKYTSLGSVLDVAWAPAPRVSVSRDVLAALDGWDWTPHRLVFVNGHYDAALSSPPPGVTAGSFAEAPAALVRACIPPPAASGLEALNLALAQDGAWLRLGRDAAPDAPVHLIFLTHGLEAPAAVFPRNLIEVGRGSKLCLIESYVGSGGMRSFTDAATDVVLEEGARLEHYKLQREDPEAVHVGVMRVHPAAGSQLDSWLLSTGARLARNEVHAKLDAEGITARLRGLYMSDGRQHVDTLIDILHAKPRCSTEQNFKGILDGRSRAVFNGRVVVAPDAQKTDARQYNRNLLLSEGAVVNTRPNLQIHADDVKCAHGVTVGSIDPDMLFYLRSRAISAEDARGLLTWAFASEMLSHVAVEPMRHALERALFAKLSGRNLEESYDYDPA